MIDLELFYATNRNHQGQQWQPDSYGTQFSHDGAENLRFGKLIVKADENKIKEYLTAAIHGGTGDGEGLDKHLREQAESATIKAYEERLDSSIADIHQDDKQLGSASMFQDVRKLMLKNSDVLIYIHGFNVAWHEAVASALALQLMLNRDDISDPSKRVAVVLFSWPSDGLALPYVSYKSDRTEAKASGYAVGRAMLKLKDYLMKIKADIGKGLRPCDQDIHLLCHSMGNYVLQNALRRIDDFTPGSVLPRIFEHIFLCSPDIDDDAFERGKPMAKLNALCRNVSIYHNQGDTALHISDYTKGNPERLGTSGAARPSLLHNKVHQIDCSPIVEGLVEHSYYLWGPVSADIRHSIDGVKFGAETRRRLQDNVLQNVWRMK